MAFDATLTLNYPRTEKVSEAWNAFHTGAGMGFATATGGDAGNAYRAAPLPSAFLRDPFTGIITLRPTFFQLDRFKTDWWPFTWFRIGELFCGGTSQLGSNLMALAEYAANTGGSTEDDGGRSGAFTTLLKSREDHRLGLSVDGKLTQWATDYRANYVWHLATGATLAPNQGWAAVISPSGIYSDQADAYFSVAFGGRFILEITGGGMAFVWGHNGMSWVRLGDYSLAAGGVNLTQPFQVSVLFSSRRFMTVYFTQASAEGRRTTLDKAPTFNDQAQGLLIILRGKGFEPQWSNALGQWVKSDAAPLTIGLTQQYYRYDFQIAKELYASGSHVLTLSPETMPKAPTWDYPKFDPRGLAQGQREPTGGDPATIVSFLRNLQGGPYSAAPHPYRATIVPELTFTASENRVYSPELHFLSISHAAQVATSAFAPIDASSDWQLIRFQRTTAPESGRIEFKMKEDARWQSVLKSDGPVRVTLKDNSGTPIPVVDGYLRRKQPTVEGMSAIVTNQAEGLDMWHRLNGTNFICDSLEGAEIADTIRKAILTAGFAPYEVEVDYDSSPELRDITFGLLRNPNDVLRPNEDTSVGDFIRDCIENYGAQYRPGLRVRWIGDKWKIYLGPIYSASAGPAAYFSFDDSLIPLLGTFASQTARYLAKVYKAFGTEEITTLQPEFNELVAQSAADITNHDQHVSRRIAADDRVINDPSYVGYEGAVNAKRLGPSDLVAVRSADTLEQQLRWYYDNFYNLKSLRTIEFEAEYQPEIDVDIFAAVIGRAPMDDPDGRFAKGDPVSYGVYRIDFIDVEIRHDGPGPSGDSRRWEWTGSYKLVFVGKWEKLDGDTPIKMFAPDSKLPLD